MSSTKDELQMGDLLAPSGGHARLIETIGMTKEQAYDAIAARAAQPDFQQAIRELEATPDGRKLLADVQRSWERAGLPCPWDCWLVLTPAKPET